MLRRAADEIIPTVAEVAETFGQLPKLMASFATGKLSPAARLRRPSSVLLSKFLLFVAVVVPTTSKAADNPVPEIHIVLFVADGLKAPPDAEEKIAAAAEYAERFFVKWMRHWDYPPARERIFTRTDDGRIRVLQINGSKPPEEYSEAIKLLQELWPKAHEKYGLPKVFPLWWVWVYKGDPPTRFGKYRGSGGLSRGGWGVVNFENRPGQISLDKEMADGFHHAFTLKGCIHEFGHALGVFHIGPIKADGFGNTLMGPNMEPFYARFPDAADEDRVYLSQAAAAILWKHFVFSGTAKDRHVIPSVEVKDYAARYDRARNEIVVSGSLESNGTAHSVVLVDEAPPRQENYWCKTYVSRIGQEGAFRVNVRQPTRAAGTFRLVFCFQNGAVTGDGKTSGRKNAFAKRYSPLGRGYRFEP